MTKTMLEEAVRAMRERGDLRFTEDDARAVWEAMETASHWTPVDAQD